MCVLRCVNSRKSGTYSLGQKAKNAQILEILDGLYSLVGAQDISTGRDSRAKQLSDFLINFILFSDGRLRIK